MLCYFQRTCSLCLASSSAAGSGLTTTGLFLICLVWSAYLKVLRVSSKLLSAGLKQAIINVLLFPPRESVKQKTRQKVVLQWCFFQYMYFLKPTWL